MIWRLLVLWSKPIFHFQLAVLLLNYIKDMMTTFKFFLDFYYFMAAAL